MYVGAATPFCRGPWVLTAHMFVPVHFASVCLLELVLSLLLLFRPVFSIYVFVMSRNTHNSLQARLFANDAPSTGDGSSSTLCETSTAGGTSLPSTTASATLAASAVPTYRLR